MANEVIKAYVTMTGPVNGRLYSATADTLTVNDTSQKKILSVTTSGAGTWQDRGYRAAWSGSLFTVTITTQGYTNGETVALNWNLTPGMEVNGLYFTNVDGKALTQSSSSLPNPTVTINNNSATIVLGTRDDPPTWSHGATYKDFQFGIGGSFQALLSVHYRRDGHILIYSGGQYVPAPRYKKVISYMDGNGVTQQGVNWFYDISNYPNFYYQPSAAKKDIYNIPEDPYRHLTISTHRDVDKTLNVYYISNVTPIWVYSNSGVVWANQTDRILDVMSTLNAPMSAIFESNNPHGHVAFSLFNGRLYGEQNIDFVSLGLYSSTYDNENRGFMYLS